MTYKPLCCQTNKFDKTFKCFMIWLWITHLSFAAPPRDIYCLRCSTSGLYAPWFLAVRAHSNWATKPQQTNSNGLSDDWPKIRHIDTIAANPRSYYTSATKPPILPVMPTLRYLAPKSSVRYLWCMAGTLSQSCLCQSSAVLKEPCFQSYQAISYFTAHQTDWAGLKKHLKHKHQLLHHNFLHMQMQLIFSNYIGPNTAHYSHSFQFF